MTKWGEAGPPDEAYSRVTDAARFTPLHALARAALDNLERRFAVRRETGTERDPSIPGGMAEWRSPPAEPPPTPAPGEAVPARHPDAAASVQSSPRVGPEVGPAPVVRLVPADPAAATLTVVFTSFPGLVVRLGPLGELTLPECGCDACDETADELAELLHQRLDALTAGTFGARLVQRGSRRLPDRYRDGEPVRRVHVEGWWHEEWYRYAAGESGGSGTRVEGPELARLRTLMPTGELTFAPWPARMPGRTPSGR